MVGQTATKASKDQNTGRSEARSQASARHIAESGPHADILDLQHAAGNRAVSELVQSRHTTSPGNDVPPIVRSVLNSSGQPLDPATRTSMESRFGHDFSRVRVHTDAKAAESAAALGASAYTFGQRVVFGRGRFDPTSETGQRLVAHELAHTVQQRGTGEAPLGTSPSREQEADRAANQVLNGSAVSTLTPSGLGVACQRSGDIPQSVKIIDEQLRIVRQLMRMPMLPPQGRGLLANQLLELELKRLRVAEAEAVAQPTLQDDEDNGGGTTPAPSPYPTTLTPQSEVLSPRGFTDADLEALAPSPRKLPSNPEEPDYWGRWWDERLLLPIKIENETKLVRDSAVETIEHPGDQANENVLVDLSYWKMTRPALRAYLVHIVGSLTEFEEKLIRGDVKAEYGLIPVVSESEIVGYYIESKDPTEPSITDHRLLDRYGKILESHETGGGAVSQGIGPLILLIPGVGIRMFVRSAANLGRGAANIGKAALARGGRLLRRLGPAAQRQALRAGLALGRAGEGATLAESTALGGYASMHNIVLVEGRAASTIAPQAATQTIVQAGTQTAVQSTAGAATQTAVQSTAGAATQTAVQSTAGAGDQTALQSVPTVTQSLAGLATTAITATSGVQTPIGTQVSSTSQVPPRPRFTDVTQGSSFSAQTVETVSPVSRVSLPSGLQIDTLPHITTAEINVVQQLPSEAWTRILNYARPNSNIYSIKGKIAEEVFLVTPQFEAIRQSAINRASSLGISESDVRFTQDIRGVTATRTSASGTGEVTDGIFYAVRRGRVYILTVLESKSPSNLRHLAHREGEWLGQISWDIERMKELPTIIEGTQYQPNQINVSRSQTEWVGIAPPGKTLSAGKQAHIQSGVSNFRQVHGPVQDSVLNALAALVRTLIR